MKDTVKNSAWLISLLLGLMIQAKVSAQIAHGGKPVDLIGTSVAVELLDKGHISALKGETQYGKGPLKYAYPIAVNYSPDNAGQWFDMGDGTLVWRLSLKSPGAESLSLTFSSFHLSDGAKVYIYDKEQSGILGAFTSDNNKSFGSLATAPVPGDEIILELQAPHQSAFDQKLVVGVVFHDFLGVMQYLKNDNRFGYSGDCNVNASCDAVVPDEIKRSVCKLMINGFLCTGTLVNNTNNDGRALMLTAAHCINSEAEANAALLYFNFDTPECIDSIAGTDQQQLSGATFLAGSEEIDFSLIELSVLPPESYRPYWAGWDIAGAVAGPVYGVHHPEGDVKKVSWSQEAPESTSFDYPGFLGDAHWKINDWSSGTTEGGSSGSGLFSADHKLIGTLSGGYASCNYPHDDYYARLNKGWTFFDEDDQQLARWLAPNSVATAVDGLDYYEGKITRLSPMSDETTASLLYSGLFDGPWSGTNDRGYDAFAQYYYDYASATVHGIYIIPALCDNFSDASVNVRIWNSIGGMPADAVFTRNNITLKELRRREYFVEVDPAIEINGEFFVGMELNSPASPDSVALYNVTQNIGSYIKNRAFIRDQGTWKPLGSLMPSGVNASFWIDILGSGLDTITEVDTLLEKTQVHIQPSPVSDGIVNYVTNLEHLSSVELYSMNGSLVQIYPRNGQKKGQLPIPSTVATGVYALVFKNSQQSIVVKVLILR